MHIVPERSVRARDMAWEWMVDAGEKFQVGNLVLVMVNKVEASSVDQIIIEVDAKSPTANINKDNLRKCHKQGKYTGIITEVYKGTYFIRLDIGVNAVAHSCNMSALPGKKDKIGFVVTRINDNYEVAEGIITRLIKREGTRRGVPEFYIVIRKEGKEQKSFFLLDEEEQERDIFCVRSFGFDNQGFMEFYRKIRWIVPGRTRIIGTKTQEVWKLRRPNIGICTATGMILGYVLPKLLEMMYG